MTVLIVDDNGTNLKLLRAVLEEEGHCVLTAKEYEGRQTARGAVRGRHFRERRHGTNQLTRIKS